MKSFLSKKKTYVSRVVSEKPRRTDTLNYELMKKKAMCMRTRFYEGTTHE